MLEVVLNRLNYFMVGKLPDDFTHTAFMHVKEAIEALNARTADRKARGVEGTHQA